VCLSASYVCLCVCGCTVCVCMCVCVFFFTLPLPVYNMQSSNPVVHTLAYLSLHLLKVDYENHKIITYLNQVCVEAGRLRSRPFRLVAGCRYEAKPAVVVEPLQYIQTV
jgi:hypothetical protein